MLRPAMASFLAGMCLLAVLLLGLLPGSTSGADLGEPGLGDPAAPVTMVEYSSLTCPHCAVFHTDTLPGLKQRFIDAGKLRLVIRDFPLDDIALKGAVIAHCGGPQRYPRFIDVFFAQQRSWARAADPLGALRQLAKLGGLSEDEIDACLADPALEEAVLRSRLEAQQKFDIRSTPSFVIDGQVYPGNRSVEEFAAIIEPKLKD